MMPRQQSIDANTSNSMNVGAHNNINFNGGGRGGNSGSGKSSGHGDHPRRYSHHGPGNGGGGESSSVGGGAVGSGGAVGGVVGGAVAGQGGAMMGDFGGIPNHQFGRAMGLTPGLGGFGPAGAGGGMNPMNPSLYPHLGHPGMSQQQLAHQDHLDFRGGGGNGVPGGNSSSASQAEREEELLLNLLIARRTRQAMRGASGHQMDPAGAGGSGPQTSWADDWMRLRQQQEQLGSSGGIEGQHQFEGGDGSRRPSAGMSLGAHGMGQLNNFNMSGGQQFLPDSSARFQHQRGNGMGLQMGSPQGAWGGNAGMMGNPGAMHSHSNTPRNDNCYAQRAGDMNMNTQLELDVLQRADPMMRPNMMYDARMAEQGGMAMGQNSYHQYSMGRQHAQAHMNNRGMGFPEKRRFDGGPGLKLDKHVNAHPMPHEDPQPAKRKRLHKKKPADMPRRPLSAYNLFFSEERERILREIEGMAKEEESDDKKEGEENDGDDEAKPKALLRPLLPSEKKRRPHRKTHGKISFQELAQKVGQRWKSLSDDRRKYYQDLAQEDMKRQKKAMEEYYQKRSALTAEAGRGTKAEE